MNERQQAIDEATAAVNVLKGSVQQQTGLNESEFEIMTRHIPSGGIPWLLKQGDRVVRVMPGESHYPEASAEDIANGKSYANAAEYEYDMSAIEKIQRHNLSGGGWLFGPAFTCPTSQVLEG